MSTFAAADNRASARPEVVVGRHHAGQCTMATLLNLRDLLEGCNCVLTARVASVLVGWERRANLRNELRFPFGDRVTTGSTICTPRTCNGRCPRKGEPSLLSQAVILSPADNHG
jgi:hypothetical protein